ncbi:MAG: hypothetical protein AAB484_02980 [Patescibacteria group bacterium]
MTQYVQAKIETMEQPMTAWIFLSIAFLFISAYVYFVNGAITYIVATKNMHAEIAQLASSVGNLEGQFLSTKTEINIEYARSIGFIESLVEPTYIAKRPSISLSFNR